MKSHSASCLILNADYSPIGIVNWQKAMVWAFKLKNNESNIEIVEYYNDYIIGSNQNYKIPAVIKTSKYFKIHGVAVNFCRKNIFIRDNYTCQYCGVKQPYNVLTYDHVIPKSKWNIKNKSATCWTNIVTACVKCNLKKSNKTPKQAGMRLITKPYEPKKSNKYLPVASHLITIKESIPTQWNLYIKDFI
tara:strand:- start:352 stop:921 length:570 start_codon:yes stop_codon:yes gene_type:complete